MASIDPIIEARARAQRDIDLFEQFGMDMVVGGKSHRAACLEHLRGFIENADKLIAVHRGAS